MVDTEYPTPRTATAVSPSTAFPVPARQQRPFPSTSKIKNMMEDLKPPILSVTSPKTIFPTVRAAPMMLMRVAANTAVKPSEV